MHPSTELRRSGREEEVGVNPGLGAVPVHLSRLGPGRIGRPRTGCERRARVRGPIYTVAVSRLVGLAPHQLRHRTLPASVLYVGCASARMQDVTADDVLIFLLLPSILGRSLDVSVDRGCMRLGACARLAAGV